MYWNFWRLKRTITYLKKISCILYKSDGGRRTNFVCKTKFEQTLLMRHSILFIFPEEWRKLLVDFYHIWPLTQWITSLISLIFLYWITGHFYNKWLSDRGGWLDFKLRIWLIISDLLINLSLGLYYMQYRDTLMGGIMLKCPIAISPIIFILELICVYMYYRFWKTKEEKPKK